MLWALDQRLITDQAARHVLIALARYADPDGRRAFPSTKRIESDTGLSERSVRMKLDLLEREGAIKPGDQAAAHFRRADRCPKVYDLALGLGLPSKRNDGRPEDFSQDAIPDGVQSMHGVQTVQPVGQDEVHLLHVAPLCGVQDVQPVSVDGVQAMQAVQRYGVQSVNDGVQSKSLRGARAAPKRSMKSQRKESEEELAFNAEDKSIAAGTLEPTQPVLTQSHRSPPPIIPDWMPLEAWNGFLEMRTRAGKRPTSRAIELLVAKLDRFRQCGTDIAEALNQSTISSWTDVYEPKQRQGGFQSNRVSPAERFERIMKKRQAEGRAW